MLQSQTRGEQGDEDQWLEIQHLRKLLREKQAELDGATETIKKLEWTIVHRYQAPGLHLSGGTR